MKFLINITQVSSCPSPSWVSPCGVPDIPVPFHRLSYPYSIPHSRLPIGGGPNTSCQVQETPVEEDEMIGLSASLQVRLYSMTEDIPHAYGCDPYSRHLSGYERSPNRISVPKDPDSVAVGLPLEHHSDTWSPILNGNSDYLSNGNSYDNRPSDKTKTFIETKVTAMKLQGFNL